MFVLLISPKQKKPVYIPEILYPFPIQKKLFYEESTFFHAFWGSRMFSIEPAWRGLKSVTCNGASLSPPPHSWREWNNLHQALLTCWWPVLLALSPGSATFWTPAGLVNAWEICSPELVSIWESCSPCLANAPESFSKGVDSDIVFVCEDNNIYSKIYYPF